MQCDPEDRLEIPEAIENLENAHPETLCLSPAQKKKKNSESETGKHASIPPSFKVINWHIIKFVSCCVVQNKGQWHAPFPFVPTGAYFFPSLKPMDSKRKTK